MVKSNVWADQASPGHKLDYSSQKTLGWSSRPPIRLSGQAKSFGGVEGNSDRSETGRDLLSLLRDMGHED
jgi:hypothetical protein